MCHTGLTILQDRTMNNTYTILPFRFARFNEEEYLLSNDVGEYIFLKNDDFHKFVNGELDPTSDLFYDIESKQIATTDKVEDVVKMLATKFRTKKSILEDFTSLHMVVPTLRCNSSCIYCQVKRHEYCQNYLHVPFSMYQNRVSGR